MNLDLIYCMNYKLIVFCASIVLSLDAKPSKQILVGKTRLTLVQGDITKQKVEAIVNAANPRLSYGGGVCGAIFEAAGVDELQKACNSFPIIPASKRLRCLTGLAKITRGFESRKTGHYVHYPCSRP